MVLLHPGQTTRHAPQRMVSSPNSRRMVSGHPWSTSQGCTVSVAILFFLVATWWGVASCEAREAAGSQMATWAGTKHESRLGVGGSTFQGAEIGEGRRGSGGQRFGRRTVVDIQAHCCISVHHGKTQIWNRGGQHPVGCESLTAAAQTLDPDAVVWRGDTQLAPHRQGIIVLGSPVGQEAFITAQLSAKREEHQVLLDRIPCVSDVQTAWLLLFFCEATRANCWIRTVSPRFSGGFAQEHDQAVMQCLGRIMHVDPSVIHPSVQQAATLPFSLGGLGIRSAFRSRESAQWASWADCLAMVKARHPVVAARIVGELGWFTSVTCLQDVKVCARTLGAVGIELPTWSFFIGRRSTPVACARACGGPVPSWVATRSLNES